MLTYFSIQWIFIQLIELLGTHKKLQFIQILSNIYKAVINEKKNEKHKILTTLSLQFQNPNENHRNKH
jgi:hypothetical protein